MKKIFLIIILIVVLILIVKPFVKNNSKNENVNNIGEQIDYSIEREIVGNEWFETFVTESFDENDEVQKNEFVDEAYDVIPGFDPQLPE